MQNRRNYDAYEVISNNLLSVSWPRTINVDEGGGAFPPLSWYVSQKIEPLVPNEDDERSESQDDNDGSTKWKDDPEW